MIKEQFELTLTNNTKLIFLLIGGVIAVLSEIAVLGKTARILALGSSVGTLLALIISAGVMYGFYRLIKKLSGEPVRIAIAPDTLTITYLKSGVEKQLPFAAIAAYRHSSYNSDNILRLTLRDGTRTRLVVSGRFHGGQEAHFAAMVRRLEAALGKYQELHGETEVLREKTFFEKTISTVLLFVLAAVMAEILWQVVINNKPVNSSFFMSSGFFVSYLVAWHAGRSRRQAS